MNVFLIGYRGAGKSAVAQRLAARLGRPAIDADERLERRAGRTIREIFATDGEPAFRDLESLVVAELARLEDVVVALGGGAVMREANRAALAGRGLTVWLTASPETLDRRLHCDPTTGERRPALTPLGGLQEIRQLLEIREPVYRACADVVFDSESRSPDELADAIAGELEHRERAQQEAAS